jgi:hypothetical protein
MASVAFGQDKKPEKKQLYENGVYQPYEVLDTRVDNMKYWRKAAELGLTPVEPNHVVPKAIKKSSRISAKSVWREDSPDVPVTDENSTQSENSIFVDPTDPDHVLQSNNSTQNPVGSLYGANYFFSYDFGETWGGSVQGAGGGNSGDPATAISLTGRQYIGFIHNNYGQGVSYSDDGVNWTSVIADAGSGSQILDKNHMWIDNSPTSPYEGNVYSAWTDFGGPNDSDIEIVYSNDNGLSYSNAINISSQLNAGSHNQGVNIETGPDGQVYAVWTIYDSWPSDESAMGFAKSLDGGTTWETPSRIISNIRGIRTSETSKNHRVNSFPVMTCDISGDGTLYVVWSNIGVPGVNTGSDIDVYMIKSSDEGDTWSEPIRVSQDDPGQGNESYFPWITCDPVTGALSVIFYDDRDVNSNQAEAWCANSFDGGETWEDFRVSDVAFTPSPIPGLAGGYMGDYLGISARDARVYPVWADNRGGYIMTYTSPYETNSLPRPEDLTAAVTFETGNVDLAWSMEEVAGFQYFIIYREDFEIATTTDTTYVDNLPGYGIYKYKVTAFHDEGESSGPSASVQWGDAHVAVDPAEIVENIDLQSTTTRTVTVENVGELDLIFEVSSSVEPTRNRDYCDATTGTEDEFIANVSIGDIDNSSGWQGGVADYTDLSTTIDVGSSEEIVVENGNAWTSDIVYVWVDWNDDFEFEQGGEEEFQLENVGGQGQTFIGEISVPMGTPSGDHRMRVRMTYSSPPEPCGSSFYGEVEDYTINVTGWMLVERITDTIAPGSTSTFDVDFDSNDLEEGTYYGNIMVESNDPDAPEVNIPVTLNVGSGFPLAVNVSADPSTICMGESSQLEADPSGGTGTFTYSWTSDPVGFVSTDPDPVVMPEESTTYFVEVDDGESVVQGQVVVTVEHTPEQAGQPEGDTDMCWGTFESVYQTSGAVGANSYNWMINPETAGTLDPDGMTVTVTWDEEFTGMATLMVQGMNGCGMGDMSEELEIMMHELPEVDLGADMTVCANEIITLDAGNTGASFMWSTGETSQTIQMDTTGVGIGTVEVWVEVTDANTCASTDTITIQFDDCTGVTELADQWAVEVFPNPSDGVFSVDIKSLSTAPVSITLFNTFGKEVYRQDDITIRTSKNIQLELSDKPEGIYLLNIKGDGINLIQKIIIQ